MSKDKKNKQDGLDEEMTDLLHEEKKLKLKKRKAMAECRHIKKSGKTRLQPTGTPHVYKCSRCGATVDFRPYVNDTEGGLEDLSNGVDVVKNACEIIKQRAAMDVDSKKSRDISDFAAQMCFQLPNILEFLKAFLTHGKDKEEKKKARKKEIKVGLDSLAFDRKGRGGKKEKKW